MRRDINRYRTKSSYQLNMIVGQAVAAIILVLPVWILSSYSTEPGSMPRETIINIVTKDESVKTPPTTPPTKRNVGGRSQPISDFHGQFGIKLRIIPDGPLVPTPTIVKPDVYALDVVPVVIDDISISILDTGDVGVFVPDDATYTFEREMATSVEPPLNQVPGVVYLVRPDIPPSATMMGAGGVVDVVLLIDPAGRPAYFSVHAADSNDNYPEFLLDVVLKDGTKATLEFYIAPQENELLYVTIKDEPKVFRFAEYLQRVLPQWRFRPALRNGEPAYGFVYIHYNFCAPDDEDCVELTIST